MCIRYVTLSSSVHACNKCRAVRFSEILNWRFVTSCVQQKKVEFLDSTSNHLFLSSLKTDTPTLPPSSREALWLCYFSSPIILMFFVDYGMCSFARSSVVMLSAELNVGWCDQDYSAPICYFHSSLFPSYWKLYQ